MEQARSNDIRNRILPAMFATILECFHYRNSTRHVQRTTCWMLLQQWVVIIVSIEP